ncbi:MAG: ABC transporter permease, partial [Clostridiales bacterium]|nr:ABC transporter permease [Clostridiales bacterium]
LTADGSFALGAAVSAALTLSGHPVLALAAALAAGGLAGLVTGLLQIKAGIAPILSGILTMSGLYTVNLAIQGGAPNLSLLGHTTLFTLFPGLDKAAARSLLPPLCCGVVLLALTWFFRTRAGLYIRAAGSNESMSRAVSVDVDRAKLTALALSNGCVALSGALLAQYQGYCDVNAGAGTMVIGLAAVVLGEAALRGSGVPAGLLATAAGSLLYQLLLAAAVRYNVFPAYAFKLVSAALVGLALSLPALRRRLTLRRERM